MKKYLFVILTFMISYTTIGQSNLDGEKVIFKAEQIYRSKQNLEKAVKLYREAFKDRMIDASNIFYAIECATITRDTAATKFFMEKGIQIGLELSDYEKSWKYFGNDMDFHKAALSCEVNSNKAIYEEHLNYKLINSLKVMAERDQEFRGLEEDKMDLQRKNDSLNWAELKNLTLQLKRLPKYSEIGIDGSDNLKIIFYHMDKDEIEWFLPYICKNINEVESNLGEVILYQLDRIGISDGCIYTITKELKIKKIATRTKMDNGYYCQTFGEWFKEKSIEDKELYFVPIDPKIPIEEVNAVRAYFNLDKIESKWKREPWVNVVSIKEFVNKIKE